MQRMRLSILIFAVIVGVFVPANPSSAQEIGLSISPPIVLIEAIPPTTVRTKVKIKNNATESTTLLPQLKPFRPLDTGQPHFLLPHEVSQEAKSLLTMAQVHENGQQISKLSLNPQQEKQIELVIELSEGIPIKDYYFTLAFVTETKEDFSGNTSLVAGGIGTNILLSLGERQEQQLSVEEFSTTPFTTKGPVAFNGKVANRGTQLVTTSGTITITNMFGQRIGRVTILPQNVLAKSSRILISKSALQTNENSLTWDEQFLLGFYKAEIELEVDSTVAARRSITFFALPTEMIIGGAGVLALLFIIHRRIRAKSS